MALQGLMAWYHTFDRKMHDMVLRALENAATDVKRKIARSPQEGIFRENQHYTLPQLLSHAQFGSDIGQKILKDTYDFGTLAIDTALSAQDTFPYVPVLTSQEDFKGRYGTKTAKGTILTLSDLYLMVQDEHPIGVGYVKSGMDIAAQSILRLTYISELPPQLQIYSKVKSLST